MKKEYARDVDDPAVRAIAGLGAAFVLVVFGTMGLADGTVSWPGLFTGLLAAPLVVVLFRRLSKPVTRERSTWLESRRAQIAYLLGILAFQALLQFVVVPLVPAWVVHHGFWAFFGLAAGGLAYVLARSGSDVLRD